MLSRSGGWWVGGCTGGSNASSGEDIGHRVAGRRAGTGRGSGWAVYGRLSSELHTHFSHSTAGAVQSHPREASAAMVVDG